MSLIRGDGIGPDVVDAALRVIAATGVCCEWHELTVGAPSVARGLEPIPPDVLATIRADGVALKGPTATPIGRSGFPSVNVGLRRALGLYAQSRRCRSYPRPGREDRPVDLVVIRETTEDLYAGVEFEPGSAGAATVIAAAAEHGAGTIPPGAGLSIKFVSEDASRRVLTFAADHARQLGRTRVTVVHKATVMRATDGVFLEVSREVAADAPDLDFDEMQVDNLCAQLVRNPSAFDVLVMGIQYGDIVSDLAAGVVGGVGIVPGVNVGDGITMFEAAHGSAPRITGTNQADPVAAILCGAMLLDHLGEHDAAGRIDAAVRAVIACGDAVTYDLRAPGDTRPPVSTDAMADAVIACLPTST